MNAGESTPDSTGLPASHFGGAIGELIQSGMMHAPTRPGLLATLDRFEIVRVLGAGGMGIVFLAHDPDTATQVAIKLLRPELIHETRAVHYFLNEAQHMRRLQHPHLLPALEVGQSGERPYFVMPYVPAGSLAKRIQPGQPLDKGLILSVARQLAEALQYAHAKGIIHRDLKPANVLMEADGHVRLTDFGLSRSLLNPSALDADGMHHEGTAPYLSPQAAAGEVEDTRCDIYAFGALLYEMLTGETPYKGTSVKEILQRIRSGPPPEIRTLNPKASPALAKIAEGAMAREHRDRYASMGDVLADLERVGRGYPPPGPHGRVGWFGTRRGVRPRALAAAVVALLALGLGLWQFWPRPRLELVRTLTSPSKAGWMTAQVGDVLGTGEPAIVVLDEIEQRLFTLSRSGEPLYDYPIDPIDKRGIMKLSLDLVVDVCGPSGGAPDGKAEAVLSWTAETNMHVAVFNQNGHEVKHFQAVGSTPIKVGGPRDVSTIRAWTVTDLDGDGRRELQALVNTGYGRSPRGVYCFDFESQTQRWSALIGPGAIDLAVTDLDQDGVKELLVSSGAVNNGNVGADGTDDRHCYVHAFSSTGKVLWSSEQGRYPSHTQLLLADLDRDARPELLTWGGDAGKPGANGVGWIRRLDSKGQRIRGYDLDARPLSCVAEDLNGDGRPEIIATDSRGFIHILNADLAVQRKLNVVSNLGWFVNLTLVGVTNFGRGSGKYIVLCASQVEWVSGDNPGFAAGPSNVRHSHNNSVLVLDSSLKLLANHLVAGRWQGDSSLRAVLGDVDRDGFPEILVLTKERETPLLKFTRWRNGLR